MKRKYKFEFLSKCTSIIKAKSKQCEKKINDQKLKEIHPNDVIEVTLRDSSYPKRKLISILE